MNFDELNILKPKHSVGPVKQRITNSFFILVLTTIKETIRKKKHKKLEHSRKKEREN